MKTNRQPWQCPVCCANVAANEPHHCLGNGNHIDIEAVLAGMPEGPRGRLRDLVKAAHDYWVAVDKKSDQ